MKDLYSGLIKPGLRPDLEPHQFYGKYEHLNNTTIPSEIALFNIQIQQLKLIEKTKNKKYKNVENFLKQAKTDLSTIENNIYQTSEEKIYTRIIELLNAGLWGNIQMNPTRRLSNNLIDKKQRDIEIKNIINEMTSLLSQLNVNQPLSKKVLDTLELRLTKKQSENFNKEYTNIKSDLAEELAVEVLNKNPGFQSIVTGKFRNSLGQQIIEDIFVFDKKNINTFFGSFGFEVKINNNTQSLKATSPQNLFDQIDALNGNYTINLSNELYDALKKASALEAQVKSGQGVQSIINRNVSNSMTLKDFTPSALIDLYQKQTIPNQYFLPEKQQYSKDLNSLANFYLSKKIAKTALTSNQLYFTSHGISTAAEWMQKNKYMLKFYPEIHSIGQDFLTKQHQYQLRKLLT